MKRLLLILISFFAFSSITYADDYCATRSSQQEAQRCYRNMIDMYSGQLTNNYRKIMASSKYTVAAKRNLLQNQKEWEQAVDAQCSDNRCVQNSLQERTNFLAHILNGTAK